MFPIECGLRAQRHDHILPIVQETRCEAAYSYEDESTENNTGKIGWDHRAIPARCASR